MNFNIQEICFKSEGDDYTALVCFNGEFYQARIIEPPTPQWAEIGIGKTSDEAVSNLMDKIKKAA